LVARVLERRREELKILERDVAKLENIVSAVPAHDLHPRVEILNDQGNPIVWGDDFGADEETILASQFEQPVIRHRLSRRVQAFYMQPSPDS